MPFFFNTACTEEDEAEQEHDNSNRNDESDDQQKNLAKRTTNSRVSSSCRTVLEQEEEEEQDGGKEVKKTCDDSNINAASSSIKKRKLDESEAEGIRRRSSVSSFLQITDEDTSFTTGVPSSFGGRVELLEDFEFLFADESFLRPAAIPNGSTIIQEESDGPLHKIGMNGARKNKDVSPPPRNRTVGEDDKSSSGHDHTIKNSGSIDTPPVGQKNRLLLSHVDSRGNNYTNSKDIELFFLKCSEEEQEEESRERRNSMLLSPGGTA
mmetsp:Transcript_9693/g.16762  ORF Transcript_9693/g.16762 Transcript_9693/m.16762 type:complete len:266 (+) Transcript_9693:11-808(+)